jgi:hypothetical protein
MSGGTFRTCPVCERLTLGQRCDHPLCPTQNATEDTE